MTRVNHLQMLPACNIQQAPVIPDARVQLLDLPVLFVLYRAKVVQAAPVYAKERNEGKQKHMSNDKSGRRNSA